MSSKNIENDENETKFFSEDIFNEIMLLQKLTHNNILRVYKFFIEDKKIETQNINFLNIILGNIIIIIIINIIIYKKNYKKL
jgi:hypothetical protein